MLDSSTEQVPSLSHVVYLKKMHLRPNSDRHEILVGYDEHDDQLEDTKLRQTHFRIAAVLTSGAASHVRARIAAIATERVVPADNLPAVGWIDERNVYLILAHSGITLSPFLAARTILLEEDAVPKAFDVKRLLVPLGPMARPTRFQETGS
ncbi:hypothetical protein CN150_35405 [Sinorhizobium meliloti]|uniref:hypothetical protein n=1 Tax=Rhizobium meliloti TaxID=382 RepID=UPI000FE01866|nr:hypothetical protein [Sinorhizobium meliloti]RVK85229.1 hypothetical protein CN150_35405 [Sinorhizobium meliloti]